MNPDSRGASVTQPDVADALLILRDIIGRSLPASLWAEVDQCVTALTTALVSGDGAALRDQATRLELLSPERGTATLVSDEAVDVSAPGTVRVRALTAIGLLESVVPVTIYLSDGDDHELVESTVEQYTRSLGLIVVGREDPVAGSWFRGMLAAVRTHVANDPVASDVAVKIHAQYLQQQNAQNTALFMQNLGSVIASLQSTKDAVIRVGAILVVKVDWTLVVTQLTARQQLKLDHSPQLVAAPQEILHVLGLQAADPEPEFPEANPAD